MKRKSVKSTEGKKHRSYYKRILIFMLVFLTCVVMPFTGILYNKSVNNVMDSINQSNESVLKQMKFNYTYFSENISALCLSTFFRYDVKELMNNDEQNYNDVYLTIKNLKDNILQSQPSLQSVTMYNAVNNSWYSTEGNDSRATEELKKYLKENGDVQKLKPILRRVSAGTEDIELYGYVFSYFMYEYSNPSRGADSFIVFNQTADGFINNLNDAITGKYPVSIYIADKEGDIYSSQKIDNQVQKELVQECIAERLWEGKEKDGFYVKKHGSGKYLISYTDLGDDTNCIVMIQNYQDIFSSMLRLRNDFIILCIVYAVVALAMLILISRRIYNPVSELVNYVSAIPELKVDEKGERLDEIGRLRQVFQKANMLNNELRQEKKSSQKIVENYWLGNLLSDSSEEAWDGFYRSMPQSVLSQAEDYALAVIGMHLDGYHNNIYAFAEEDRELLLDTFRNVLQETLEPDFASAAVNSSEENVVLILNAADANKTPDHIVAHIREAQDFMKQHFDVTVSVAYSGISSQPTDLSALYEEAKRYEKYKIVWGKAAVLGKQECDVNMNNSDTTYPREMKRKLDERLKLGNKEQIYQVLDEIQASISRLSYDNIIINSMSLVTRINTVVNEINLMKNYPVTIHFDKMYQAVLEIESLDDLFAELKEYIDSILMETYQTKEKEIDKEKLFVETVIQFVNENYTDINLSSQSIADHMNMSSRYIMKKFKKCTDISLNEFILNVRMKQAVHLLTNTDMSVNQVTENIGIENENYFYRLFKKVYGCTPREFAKKREGNG